MVWGGLGVFSMKSSHYKLIRQRRKLLKQGGAYVQVGFVTVRSCSNIRDERRATSSREKCWWDRMRDAEQKLSIYGTI